MRKLYTLPALVICLSLSAQNDLKTYQWRDHLPYNVATSVTSQGNKIFATSNECAYGYDKDQNTYSRMNKVHGYSDIRPQLIKNNPYNNAIVIIYDNSNIDVVKNDVVTNASDLLRKQNIGDKTVNSITFYQQYAYLACNFGIVVLNTEKVEITDTYIIGPNATNLLIYQIAIEGNTIYAATKTGVFQAALNSANLTSYTSWSKVTGLPNGPYNGIVAFGGNVITNFSKNIQSGISMRDTMYQFDGTSWGKYTPKIYEAAPGAGTYTVNKMIVSADGKKLLTCDQWGIEGFDLTGATIVRLWNFGFSWTLVLDVIPDPTEPEVYWVATTTNGFLKAKNNTATGKADTVIVYSINGPPSNGASSLAIKDDKLLVAPSYLGFAMPNNWLQYSPFYFNDGVWKEAVQSPTDTMSGFLANIDLNQVAFDPNDKNHYYATSWFRGVLEYVNDKEVARYDCNNTTGIHSTDYPQSKVSRTSGVTFDKENNLWVGLGETQNCLSARKADGTWVTFDFAPVNPSGLTPRVSHVIVDSTKQVWEVAYGFGLFVYKHDGSFTKPTKNNAKLINNAVNNGGLPSNNVISIAEDKNGDIWVGTDKGIYVFYNPESIFTQTSGWDAQPIYIEQDGKTQLLLQTDEVVCITVDGANNKWCGTRNSGLYCFSPDGQKQLFHFTIDNSPLFSNNIVDTKVNPKTGEVYIATDKGVLSFQNTIIEGLENYDNVYAYPNPIKSGYDGPVLIHGLINGSTVKIIDPAGNFVYQTTSQGGQAIWDGKNFHGQRVASGLYLVMCSLPNGEKRVMTKILLLN
jgi:hypothetical protein